MKPTDRDALPNNEAATHDESPAASTGIVPPAPTASWVQNVRVLSQLTKKAVQVAHQIATSPAIRSHVVSIARSEGVFGILRRASRIRSNLAQIEKSATLFKIDDLDFESWMDRFDTPSAQEYEALQRLTETSSVTITLLVTKPDKAALEQTLRALADASFRQWQVNLVFATSLNETSRKAMMRLVPPQPAPRSDQDVYHVILMAGVQVRRHALELLVAWMKTHQTQALVYGDAAIIEDGKYTSWFKPDYSSLMAQSGLLFDGLIATQGLHAQASLTAIAHKPEEWQKILLQLAAAVGADAVGHIPHVLSIHTQSQPDPIDVTPTLQSTPRVSIIIPTRNYWSVLKPCLDSLRTTNWPRDQLEIIVVDNGSDEQETLNGLIAYTKAGDVRVIRHDRDFNWSELNNVGAAHASGSVLVFLNNDVEVIDPDWLRTLVAFVLEPKVGAVGCKLLYPDRTIQHGGVVIGIQGVAAHAHLLLGQNEGGYRGLANVSREVSSVTGACIAVEKLKFETVGRFDESFKVAFNDVAFCLTMKKNGYHNVYAAQAALLHHESKSRGYDTTPEKVERNRQEMMAIWQRFRDEMREDPLYSPNLSYREAYLLSRFPRSKPVWAAYTARKPRILMLSITHAKGHGVPVIVALQAEALVKAGFDVIVAGPRSMNDFPYEGCTFLEVHDPETAAYIAYLYRVDCVVAHTPRFFSSVRWLGRDIPFLSYDYGEPPADWFPDKAERLSINVEKEVCFAMADRTYAISEAVRHESMIRFDGVIPLANSHLGTWSDDLSNRRDELRTNFGFDKRFVILNVCRFHRGERHYKGVDRFVEVMRHFARDYPELAEQCRFVLCGKGTPKDISEMQKEGLTIFANVTDETMVDLYVAADAYMNFSQWEGYNLGVAQALAMGLPTLASDIPAHRAFGIEVSNDYDDQCKWLSEQIAHQLDAQKARTPKVWHWETPLAQFVEIVSDMVKNGSIRRAS